MRDRIATVTIKNIETGEKIDLGEYFFFPTGSEMSTIVMVKGIKTYCPLPNGNFQVDFECKALDSAGMVFNLEANFTRHTPEDKMALLSDITPNSVHIFYGQFGVDENGSIALTEPEYCAVEPDFEEDEVREAFRKNEEYRINAAFILSERPYAM